MKPKIFLAAMILGMCASGCSKSIPSEEDAKKAISSLVGDCKYLSIENFKKTNGMQKDNNNYIVSIEYEIHVKPIPENKKSIEEHNAKLPEIDERHKNAYLQSVAASEEIKDLLNKREAVGERWENARKNEMELNTLQESIGRERDKFVYGELRKSEDKFAAECPSTKYELKANLYSGADSWKYAQEFTIKFSGDMSMVKTENGWIPAN